VFTINRSGGALPAELGRWLQPYGHGRGQHVLGMNNDIRNGFGGICVHFDIRADASPDDIKSLVAQSQKRSAVLHHHQPDECLYHRQLTTSGEARRMQVRKPVAQPP
jgi:hypothetical protein